MAVVVVVGDCVVVVVVADSVLLAHSAVVVVVVVDVCDVGCVVVGVAARGMSWWTSWRVSSFPSPAGRSASARVPSCRL